MNKTELIEKIAAGSELSKADAKKALDATVAAIKDALVAGDKISLVGFGTFSVNERPARPCGYRLSSHFLPRLVLSQSSMPPTMMTPIVNTTPSMFIIVVLSF